MTRAADVVVIGAGLVGSWTAFWLRRRGASVILLERDRVGSQSSGVNLGSLRIQGRALEQLPLSLQAQALWEDLPALVGTDCEFETTGHAHLAFDAVQLDKIIAYSRASRGYGLQTEILEPGEIRRRWPWLRDGVVGASWSPRDAAANPRLATPAVARANVAAGVTVIEQAEVVRVVRHGDGFRVHLADGRTADGAMLVNAAGAWGPAIAGGFGERVPLFVAGPADMVTEPVPRFIPTTLQAVDGSVVVRQVARGNIIIAGHPRGPVDAIGRRGRVPPQKMLLNMQRAAELIPAIAAVSLIRCWTGIEGYLPDMLPIIGPSRTEPGLVHGFGLCGHGFQIAPAVGQVLADLLIDGNTATPIGAFDIGRFDAPPRDSGLDAHQEFDEAVLAHARADRA